MNNKYICLCGKTFDFPNHFNGHRAGCRTYLESVGKWDYVHNMRILNGHNTRVKLAKKRNDLKKAILEQWISEKHICEKCGKLMTEKFGSGRFCSRSCANSREKSIETKLKLSNTFSSKSYDIKHHIKNDNEKVYLLNPNICLICGNILDYNHRNRKTCSNECKKAYISKTRKNQCSEIRGLPVEGRHIVYKVTYIKDGRYYIGVRKTDVDFDGYMGSGIHIKNMIKKYGKENFIRETLFEFNNSVEAFEKEKELLAEHLNNPLCVNIASGGQGGKTH